MINNGGERPPLKKIHVGVATEPMIATADLLSGAKKAAAVEQEEVFGSPAVAIGAIARSAKRTNGVRGAMKAMTDATRIGVVAAPEEEQEGAMIDVMTDAMIVVMTGAMIDVMKGAMIDVTTDAMKGAISIDEDRLNSAVRIATIGAVREAALEEDATTEEEILLLLLAKIVKAAAALGAIEIATEIVLVAVTAKAEEAEIGARGQDATINAVHLNGVNNATIKRLLSNKRNAMKKAAKTPTDGRKSSVNIVIVYAD